MAEAILPFDAADYLTSEEAVADYLAAAFETGDATDVSHALATIGWARGVGKTLLPLLRAMGMTLTVRRPQA